MRNSNVSIRPTSKKLSEHMIYNVGITSLSKKSLAVYNKFLSTDKNSMKLVKTMSSESTKVLFIGMKPYPFQSPSLNLLIQEDVNKLSFIFNGVCDAVSLNT